MTSRVTVLLSLCMLGLALADTIYLSGIIRDQGPDTMWDCGGNPGTANGGAGWSGTDFQISGYQSPEFGLCGAECNSQNGWVPPACGQLAADRTPTYAYPGESPGKNIHSPASFYNWFHDSNETIDISFNLPLTLIPGTSQYQYINDSFFPLDGIGWTDHCYNAAEVFHNFAYCFEAHSRFGYTGVEVFDFAGDDDVYVFINQLLVIDLGSLHTKLSKSIQLNQNPTLVVGQTYRMDFFYCERHTTESDIELTTTLQFYCAYTDWCGVCEGTGQSCCTTAVIAQYCNDNNACTIDGCSVQTAPADGGCTHTAIPPCANSTSLCQTSACDPVQGCVLNDVVCNDNNPCTTDTCSATLGCQFTPIVCNDNNVCTTDACTNGNCVYTNITATQCNDNNACTNDGCNPQSGCTHTTVNCNDNNMCTSDSCDTSSGCQNTVVNCNDNNACTTDSCNAATGCQNAEIPCNAVDLCHTAACDKVNGCIQTLISCNDNNPCTNDSCNPTSGCVNKPVNCDDGDACTADSCSQGQCLHITTDPTCGVCGTTTCTWTDPCNPVLCNKTINACGTVPVVCNDQNACTTDSCTASADNSKVSQCNYDPITCSPQDSCHVAICDKVTGCGNVAIICNDFNNCTTDACVPTTGNYTCTFTAITCDNSDPCNPQSCNALTGTCESKPVDCDDGNACTTDQCTSTSGAAQCTHTPKVCGTACDPSICNTTTGDCVDQPRICNDNNPCTQDSNECVGGVPSCNFTLISGKCDDNDVCTNDACNSSGTEAAPCIHVNITCVPNICEVYTNYCSPVNGCQYEPKQCPGTGDFCQQGACDNHAGCITVQRVCTVSDPGCYVSTCNSSLAKCVQAERPDWASAYSQTNPGVLCPLVYDQTVKKATISAGVIAGATIGAVAGAALIGVGGKAGYDFLQARSGGMGNVKGNPLYAEPAGGGTNALYNS